jgi:hypothetical protein
MKKILFLFVVFYCSNVFAQKNITNQKLGWYVYVNTIEFNKKWFLITEVQERFFINPTSQHQLLLRTHLHRTIFNGFDVALGFCYLLQDRNDPFNKDKFTVPELRPHAEINYKKKFKYFTWENRFRFELRYFHEVNKANNQLEDGYAFGNYRFRYQAQFTIPLVKIANNQFLKLKIFDEVFVNTGESITKNIFDHNRIFVGLNVDVLPNLAVEAGYMNWYQQRPSGLDFYNRDIIRVAVFHKIQVHKNKLSSK